MINSKKKNNPGTLGTLPNLIHFSIFRGFALLNNFTEDDHDHFGLILKHWLELAVIK